MTQSNDTQFYLESATCTPSEWFAENQEHDGNYREYAKAILRMIGVTVTLRRVNNLVKAIKND